MFCASSPDVLLELNSGFDLQLQSLWQHGGKERWVGLRLNLGAQWIRTLRFYRSQ